jgi:hypothetical protein
MPKIETLEAARGAAISLGIPPHLIEPYSKDWTPPAPDDIRKILTAGGLSGSAAGALVGVDGRTIRKWTGGDRAMPYAALVVLLSAVGCGEIWLLK